MVKSDCRNIVLRLKRLMGSMKHKKRTEVWIHKSIQFDYSLNGVFVK